MRLFCGLVEGNAEREVLFKIIGKEGVVAYPCDFARCFRWAYRRAVLSCVQLVAERLTDRTSEFRALATGNRMERLEQRFIATFILEDANGCLREGMRRMDKDISVIQTTGIAKVLRRRPLLLRWLPK